MIVPVPLPSQSPVCLINFLNGFAISIPAYLEETTTIFNNNNNHLTALFQDNLGKPVPER